MQFAFVNGKRSEAFAKGRGICPLCNSIMIAKCGQRHISHWAHHRDKNCDPWWENETEWHREWKNIFPEECREVSHTADDGEIHRADIKTHTGIVIEFQHSNMSDEERMSREEFYKNLVWVIDGRGFRKNFDIYHKLPDPKSAIAQDIIWYKAKHNSDGANVGLFLRLSEAEQDNPNITKATLKGGFVHGIQEIENEIDLSYNGYHQYDWIRPRQTWLDAKCPVYIDFGDDYLVKLEVYDSSNLKCIRYVMKRKFIHDVVVETDACAIATRFYPIK